MILQKKTDRRKKRIESHKEELVAEEDMKDQYEPRRQSQGDYGTPKQLVTNGGGGGEASPSHIPRDRGDDGFTGTPKPANGDMTPSPTDKGRGRGQGGYMSYHQQPQQQSFNVGKWFRFTQHCQILSFV